MLLSEEAVLLLTTGVVDGTAASQLSSGILAKRISNTSCRHTGGGALGRTSRRSQDQLGLTDGHVVNDRMTDGERDREARLRG